MMPAKPTNRAPKLKASKPKGGGKRSLFQRDKDLATIADMYLRGVAQVDIAQTCGVTQQQISKDIREIRDMWIAASVRDFSELRAEQLAKVDALEQTYWDAWENSKRDSKRQRAGIRKGGTTKEESAETVTECRDGNPAFLAGVDKCIERRCKLLGLDAPAKVEVNDTTPRFILPENAATEGTDLAPTP